MPKKITSIFVTVFILFFLLAIPAPEPPVPTLSEKPTFAWNQDEVWEQMEAQFTQARKAKCEDYSGQIDSAFVKTNQLLDTLKRANYPAGHPYFKKLETQLFTLGPILGACMDRLEDYMALFGTTRQVVKQQSQHWDMNEATAKSTAYRILYGGRMGIEELILQQDPTKVNTLLKGIEEPSATPSASFHGVTIHSGDILISRGNAPTSALIARGNNYPGNFSHIALVHIDEKTGAAKTIEAHIEVGVVVLSAEEYLKDPKLRIMVLRPRADLPALQKDPMLPHKAATYALQKATAGHIAYDFSMDYEDASKLFCSEVASDAYGEVGINLWMGISSISTEGTAKWLSYFGVEHTETQEPADLEYDPQMQVVAEWRRPETLYQDHIDNAVIDVLLEQANAGKTIGYQWYLLPVVRLVKGYCWVLNQFGKHGPVPEGMSATSALRHRQFDAMHKEIKAKLLPLAEDFKQKEGYTPPYWELVKMARMAANEVR